MIIFYGHRFYGRIDGHGAEYLATTFAHVYFLPLFPTGSRWVTRQVGDQVLGFDVKLSARSVAAAYLRIWAPLLALGLGATLTIPGIAVAVGLLALSAWSWTWLRIRGGHERRRALLNQIAFGAACDPMRRPVAQCEALRCEVDQRFAEVSGARTPEDVARFGADSPAHAALAYASLRLVAAIAGGDTGRKARAVSDSLLDNVSTGDARALADGGPYRVEARASDSVVSALEAAAAAVIQAQDRGIDESIRAAQPASAWDNSPENPAVKEEIARNKAQRAGTNRLAWVALVVVAVASGAYVIYDIATKHVATDRALTELRSISDELCRCPTRACFVDLLEARRPAIDRAERTVRENESSDSELDQLADRAERCYDALP